VPCCFSAPSTASIPGNVLQVWEQCGGKTGPRGSGIVLGDFAWASRGGPVCPSGTTCTRQVLPELLSQSGYGRSTSKDTVASTAHDAAATCALPQHDSTVLSPGTDVLAFFWCRMNGTSSACQLCKAPGWHGDATVAEIDAAMVSVWSKYDVGAFSN
jgi:hypothetical protein